MMYTTQIQNVTHFEWIIFSLYLAAPSSVCQETWNLLVGNLNSRFDNCAGSQRTKEMLQLSSFRQLLEIPGNLKWQLL